MNVGIHQPECLPFPGFFKKIKNSNIFVILDHVQFRKNYFQNRNLFIDNNGKMFWFTFSLKKHSSKTNIKDIKVRHEDLVKRWNKIAYSYAKYSFFNEYRNKFENIIFSSRESLVDYNIDFIKLGIEIFGIKSHLIKSSELDLPLGLQKNELNLFICKTLNADSYVTSENSLSGYLDTFMFSKKNIKINIVKNDIASYTPVSCTQPCSIFHWLFTKGPSFCLELISD